MHFVVSSKRRRSSEVCSRSVSGSLGVADQVGEHHPAKNGSMSTIILEDRKTADRLDRHLGRDVANEHLSGEHVAAVDHLRVRAAGAVGARAAQGERAVLVPLDLVKRVKQAIVRVGLDRELVPPDSSPRTSGLCGF